MGDDLTATLRQIAEAAAALDNLAAAIERNPSSLVVGKKKALYLAVRDWRRAPRHTAVGGLLDGTLRFVWQLSRDPSSNEDEDPASAWDGLSGGVSAE